MNGLFLTTMRADIFQDFSIVDYETEMNPRNNFISFIQNPKIFLTQLSLHRKTGARNITL
jgi:hypothetical protein